MATTYDSIGTRLTQSSNRMTKAASTWDNSTATVDAAISAGKKVYFEVKLGGTSASNTMLGFTQDAIVQTGNILQTANSCGLYFNLLNSRITIYWGGTGTGNVDESASYSSTDVIGITFNYDTMEMSYYKNNVLQNTVNFITEGYGGFSSDVVFGCSAFTNATWFDVFSWSDDQTYTAPSGFTSLEVPPESWITQSSVMTIDETSVYSDVLTPAEVANLYHSYLTYGSGSQLLEDTSNDTHGLSYSFDFVSDTDYTLTISAKALTRDYIHLSLPAGAFGTEQRAAFNLSAGTSASESGSPTIAMTSTGDGWYRCSISATATATATASFNYYASDGTLTYTGNGYYGISVNFAQLEESGSFTTYEKDGLSQETQVETIGSVPGTGQLLGIHYYNDTVYVFRNAADNATAVMWASSANGWTSKKTGLTPNGKYRCVNYAFGATQKMYIVSGVHKAAEWDGTTWTDITTGMSPDTPEHVIGHKKHLFLAFGNSVQHSPLGDPTGTWSVLTGASEMVLPYQVTGFSTLSNGSLGIFSREGIIQLAGTSSADWVANNMTEYSNNAGAKPDTIQSMGNKMFFLDSRGITELGASDTSSDFYDSLISHAVDNRFRDKWANAICSCVVREKGQYRLFFNDGSGLIMTVVNNQIMFTEMELPHRIQCIVSSEDSAGDEVIYFGSDDGYVRQMEKGKHFDIQNINCSVQTAPFNCGHKGFVKRFRRLKFDTSTVGTSSLSVTPIFSLENTGAPVKSTPEIIGTGSLLGTSLLGISLLGAGLVREGDIDLEDHAEWIRLLFTSSDNDQFPWEIDGYTVDYFLGRKRR